MAKILLISLVALMLGGGCALKYNSTTDARPVLTPVKSSHLEKIESLFADNGLREASVELDQYGRVELKGTYKDKSEVELAFALAQAVIGPKWVSPVVPENIKVKEWEKKFSGLFPKGNKPAPVIIDQSNQPGPIRKKYAAVIGISKFNVKEIELKYAAKDATDFYNFLISQKGGDFQTEDCYLLTNEKATKANIVAAFDDIKNKAKEDDLVVLYFSSHGTPPDPSGNICIVTYDSIIKKAKIWNTSITDEMLRDFINSVRAKRFVAIMDACFSSAAYSKVDGLLPKGGKSLGVLGDETYGRSKSSMAKNLLGAKDIMLADEEEPSKNGKDGDKGWGKVLFSASDAGEKSWESDSIRNGFFSFYFLKGINKYGDVKRAFEYAEPLVVEEVMKEKEADQHPQVVSNRKEWDISIATR